MSGSRSSCRSENLAADAVSCWLRAPRGPWPSGLAALLAASSPAWRAFNACSSYGTARFLASDSAGPRDVVGEIRIAGQLVPVEILPQELAARFARLRPITTPGPDDLDLVRKATALLEAVPDLAAAVSTLVFAIHLLRADQGYDVSHSEPTIPFSIFVSVPSAGERHAVLRLAESIVHEAMHLQLTLMEKVVPLVSIDGEGYSPWQGCERPIGGLLHGLYVFSAIARFMDCVAAARPEMAAKARLRRAEIEEEVSVLPDFGAHLTPTGETLRLFCLGLISRGLGA